MLLLPKDASYQQICEAWIRLTEPNVAETEIAEKARAFFEASPSGELNHVFEARLTLIAAGRMEGDWVSTLPENPADGAICYLETEGKRAIHFFSCQEWHPL